MASITWIIQVAAVLIVSTYVCSKPSNSYDFGSNPLTCCTNSKGEHQCYTTNDIPEGFSWNTCSKGKQDEEMNKEDVQRHRRSVKPVKRGYGGYWRDYINRNNGNGKGKRGKNRNIGYNNQGENNVGYNNQGENNVGNGNHGDNNVGSNNVGDNNIGDGNIGNKNIGNDNNGNENLGDGHVGNGNGHHHSYWRHKPCCEIYDCNNPDNCNDDENSSEYISITYH